jgi:hypothetical protein
MQPFRSATSQNAKAQARKPTAACQPALFMKVRSEATKMGMDAKRIWCIPASASEGIAGVRDSTSRSPTERNAVGMPDPPPQ